MRRFRVAVIFCAVLILGYQIITKTNLNFTKTRGEIIDQLDHVPVYFNGGVGQVSGRNLAPDGYNIGLQFQCVEFVKRYYLEVFHHKMPDSYGHARDFFDPMILDGQINPTRGLLQFINNGKTPPQKGDLLVFKGTWLNRFGHVAIVSKVSEHDIEYIGQNHGPFSPSRYHLELQGNLINSKKLLGWLRMPED